ncbi:MAG: cytochrome P450 [Deltaproteobacteria bacterium]|nr:MAG: cytochrome P450 [Deltaproteobacteria bacterium]
MLVVHPSQLEMPVKPTRTLRDLPMPPLDPRVGRVTGQAMQMRADHHGLIHETLRTCGDYGRLRLFWAEAIVIASPEGAKCVLQTDAANYNKNNMGYREVARVLGDGLFTSDGDQWRDNRVVLQPFFTRKTLAHYGEKMRKHSEDLAGSIPEGPVDLAEETVALTLRILGDCIFDEDFEPYVPLMLEEFGTVLRIVNERVVNHVPLVDTLNVLRERTFQASLGRFNDAVQELVDKALADPDRAASQTSVIHALHANEATRDPKNVRDQVITMMFAGHETSAVALQWIFHTLATQPEWREKVEAEIDAAEGFDELPVLERVIQETLRLYPPVWIVTRRIEDDVVIDGIEVKKGTLILVSIFTIHRNPKYWDDPDRFDPDRFLPERTKDHVKGQYLPFGMGKRACVGSRMAMLELKTIVATLLREVRFDLAPGSAMHIESSLTLRPEGAEMICTRRQRGPS